MEHPEELTKVAAVQKKVCDLLGPSVLRSCPEASHSLEIRHQAAFSFWRLQ